MRKHFGGFAALCVGACLGWSSCGGGGVDPSDTTDVPAVNGAKTAAGGSAGQPAGGGAAGSAADTGVGTDNPGGSAGVGTNNPGGSAGQVAGRATGTTAGASAGSAAGQQMAGTTSATPTGGAGGTPAGGAGGMPATGAGTTATTPATGGAPATTPAAAPGGSGGAAVTPPQAGTTGAAVAPAAAASSAGATIVPLYTDPSQPSWTAIVAAKAAHPRVGVIAVVNPANGPGGGMNSAYAVGISKLVAAGIKVIGYVATGYGANSAAQVKADIDRWQNFYPGQIGGIFFDEQSNKADYVGYYRDLSQHAKSKGLSFTVGNPGTDTAEAYVGALDTMLIYESAGLPSAAAMGGWHSKYPASNFGVIPYAAGIDPTFVRSARKSVGYVYVQNDTLPNPWDSLPANFADLLAALE
jgi:hypothetical protein